MSFLPLTLGVGQTSHAGGGGAKTASKSEAEKILKRDDFSCRFCGFRSAQYQRVILTSDGFVTACSFCEQVMALDRASMMGGGVLIWLPEISQAELNHILRAIYVARADEKNPMTDIATQALDALMARRTEVKKRLGAGCDDPMILATILHENLSDKEHAIAIEKLEGIRLLCADKYMVRGKSGGDINGFPQIVKFWRSPQGPYAQLPTEEWESLFTKVAA